jgi:hypothetical protein
MDRAHHTGDRSAPALQAKHEGGAPAPAPASPPSMPVMERARILSPTAPSEDAHPQGAGDPDDPAVHRFTLPGHPCEDVRDEECAGPVP